MKIKRPLIFLFFLFIFPCILHSKTLDQAFSEIFSKILKQFSYNGEVVALIPDRDEAALQFENNIIPPVGAEVLIYRPVKKIYNQITGKFIGYINQKVGMVSITDHVGTVAIGTIIDNSGNIKVGDKARFTKKLVIILKGIKNLTDRPIQAYDVNSYMELAEAKFHSLKIISPQVTNISSNKDNDAYYINMKVYLKDSVNPNKKELIIRFSSFYTGMDIAEYSSEFDMTKKMLSYSAPTQIQAGAQAFNNIQGVPSYPGIPMYPMTPQPVQNPQQNVPAYPISAPSIPKPNIAKITPPKKFNIKHHETQPLIDRYTTLLKILDKVDNIDFNGNFIVYSTKSSIIYGEYTKKGLFKKFYIVNLNKNGKIINIAFMDIDNDGFKEIIANYILKNKIDSMIFKIKNRKLLKIKDHIKYILGGFDFDNDKKLELGGQSFNKKDIYGNSLYELSFKNGIIKRIKTTWIPNGFRLPYSIKIDIDNDKVQELIFIGKDNELMVYKNGEDIYSKKLKGKIINVKPISIGNKIIIVENANGKTQLYKLIKSSTEGIIMEPFSKKFNGKLIGIYYNGFNIIGCLVKDNRSFIIKIPVI